MSPNSHTTIRRVNPPGEDLLIEVVTGQQPLTPSMIAAGYKGPSPPAYKFAKDDGEDQASRGATCLLGESRQEDE